DAALAACRDRLSKTADLKQYTTAAAVEDLEAVRQALGYDRIDILGISYGTRVGFEYLRKYGSKVRSMAASGVYSPDYRVGLNGPRESQRALQEIFTHCAADAGCNGAFPKLQAEYNLVLA